MPCIVLCVAMAVDKPLAAVVADWNLRTCLRAASEQGDSEFRTFVQRVTMAAARNRTRGAIALEKYTLKNDSPPNLAQPAYTTNSGTLDLFLLESPASVRPRCEQAATPREVVIASYCASIDRLEWSCQGHVFPSWTNFRDAREKERSVRSITTLLYACSPVIYNNVGASCLSELHAKKLTQMDIEARDGAWMCIPTYFLQSETAAIDGSITARKPFLAYPLIEATGAYRNAPSTSGVLPDSPPATPPARDTHARTSPFLATVESPDFDPRVGAHSLMLVPKPVKPPPAINDGGSVYLCALEPMADWDPPVVSIYKAPTWEPFKEDYLIRMGIPDSTIGLRAVAVFSNIKDEDLKKLIEVIGVKDEAQGVNAAPPPKTDGSSELPRSPVPDSR